MRGRTLFHLLKPLLVGSSAILELLPSSLVHFLLVIVRHVPTRLGTALRYILTRRLAINCGDNVAVFEGVYLFGLCRASFGDNVSIHPMCYIDATGGLRIGSNVSIAHGTTVVTTQHDFSQLEQNTRDAPVIVSPVTIGDDVWIGAGVRILGSVMIGNHAVIGAGAVVTRDIPPNVLAVGVPARVLKSLHKV